MTGATIGVPREAAPGERRVALVPDVVRRLAAAGAEIVVESGAGAGALIDDASYVAAGARIGDDAWDCDIVVKVAPPTPAEIDRLREDAVLVGFLGSAAAPARRARHHGVRHGGDPAHQPRPGHGRALLAGHDRGLQGGAVAAEHATRLLPMMTTAAGTLPPARVLVLGAGVAGLQALATARRLGARCTGYDVRPEAAEQVRSVGADWLDLGIEAAGEGGYARALTDDERAAQQHALGEAIKRFDIVITTALVPGRPGAATRQRRRRRRHAPGQRDRRSRGRDRRQLRAHPARGGLRLPAASRSPRR